LRSLERSTEHTSFAATRHYSPESKLVTIQPPVWNGLLEIVRKLASETGDYRLLFNEANLAQLAEQTSEAYDSWIRYLEKLGPGPEVEKLMQPLVARIGGESWSLDAYREAVGQITMQCQASVSALSETPFEENEGCTVELQLYNPRHDKVGKESPLIPIAEPYRPLHK
jgi:hypothetical protein